MRFFLLPQMLLLFNGFQCHKSKFQTLISLGNICVFIYGFCYVILKEGCREGQCHCFCRLPLFYVLLFLFSKIVIFLFFKSEFFLVHQFILAFSYTDIFVSFPNATIIIIKLEIVFDVLGWEKNLQQPIIM